MVAIQPKKYTLHNAVSSTATSAGVPVNNAGRLSLMVFAQGAGAAVNLLSSTAVFTVEVTNDQTVGWVPYNRLTSNATNTNAQFDTRVASLQQVGNGTAMLFFPPGDTFNFVRVIVGIFQATTIVTATYSAVLYVD